jgi:hypothetical protein
MDRLARRLLADGAGRLSPTELDAILSWLGGGERNGASRLSMALGRPETRPERVSQLYRLLDRQILAHGRLDFDAAHLSGVRPEAEKKARFRRLIQAFHPDRYPELEAWLTPRSQVLHAAYSGFKRGVPQVQSTAPAQRPGRSARKTNAAPVRKTEHPWQPGPFRQTARLVPERVSVLRRILGAGRRTQRLSSLLIVSLATIAVLPLLALNLAGNRDLYAGRSISSENEQQVQGMFPAQPRLSDEQHGSGLEARRAAILSSAEKDEESVPLAASAETLSTSIGGPIEPGAEQLATAQVEAFLERFSRYIIGGDLEGLLALVDNDASAPDYVDTEWLTEHFGTIFATSRRRHQEFRVISIEHLQPYWSVQTLSKLTMAFDDLTARHDEQPYRLILRRKEDGALRIVGIDG